MLKVELIINGQQRIYSYDPLARTIVSDNTAKKAASKEGFKKLSGF
jgi:hypothetical protein